MQLSQRIEHSAVREAPGIGRVTQHLALTIDPHDALRSGRVGVIDIEARCCVGRGPKVDDVSVTRLDRFDARTERLKSASSAVPGSNASSISHRKASKLPVTACNIQNASIASPSQRCSLSRLRVIPRPRRT